LFATSSYQGIFEHFLLHLIYVIWTPFFSIYISLCFPYSFQIPVSTIPEISEQERSQETPITEHVPKGNAQEEKSTADSPPKGSLEGAQQDLPHIEMTDQVDEGSKKEDEIAVEYGPVEKDKVNPVLGTTTEPKQQDQNLEGNEDPSTQRSPSFDDANMSHYFESSNEEDISAQPGGSSIDPQSSTSKISAAAGIPESLLQGLNVSTQKRRSRSYYLGVVSTQIVKELQLLRRMKKRLGLNKRT
jgi:hypothetical protein